MRSRSKLTTLSTFVWVVLLAAVAEAQPPAPPASPMDLHLFPPELIQAHQEEIGLAAAQRLRLEDEVRAMRTDLASWQLELVQVTEELIEVVSRERVDESAALFLVDRMTGLELHVKKRYLAALIRLKNMLSAEQQKQLRALR